MVERFVEAVLRDGVAVGSVLALTFTEKAAGELRERLRRRFTALGEIEHAREAEAAWIGTIHGFCARVLRARPLAAGLDPRFTVLDEAAARRLAERAYETALEAWAAAGGAAALDLAAAYGPALRGPDPRRARDAAQPRARPIRGCRSRRRSRRPIPPRSTRPRAAAAAALATRGDGKKVAAAREALDALRAIRPRPRCRGPASSTSPSSVSGAKALEDAACADYREAWEAYRGGVRRPPRPRRAGRCSTTCSTASATAFDAAKAARAARRLRRPRAARARPARRPRRRAARGPSGSTLIMVDEFQDTNRLQLDVLEALERDNLFAVGDELQSIYRFRHADVAIFRERRGAARRGPRPAALAQLPLARGAARRAQRRLHGRARRRVRAAGGRAPPAAATTGRCGCSTPTRWPPTPRSSC